MATTEELLQRITANPEIYGGKPIIRGHRMAVEHVLSMMGAGTTVDQLLEYFRGWSATIFRRVSCMRRGRFEVSALS